MTTRKIIEQISLIKSAIGAGGFLTEIQDCISVIQSNANNIVLLKEMAKKIISCYEAIETDDMPRLLSSILIGKQKLFTSIEYNNQIAEALKISGGNPNAFAAHLNACFSNILAVLNTNITELDKIYSVVHPFLARDYSELQVE